MGLEKKIRDKAFELGYEKCGIIPICEMEGYDERLMERQEREPSSKLFYQKLSWLTHVKDQYPWAESIVIAVSGHGRYKVPDRLEGRIGKHYIFDGRCNAETAEYRRNAEMDKFLLELGLKTASEKKFGAVGFRWAAMKAGLGIVRRNNFFYTESGSMVVLEGWITDRKMEYIESAELPPCPAGCDKCMKACPTNSLSSPFAMNPLSCVSFLTTTGGRDLPNNPLRKNFGTWIYGCDACQDACPMNAGKRAETDCFPGTIELAPRLTPENIMAMDEEFYRQSVQPKYFYLSPDELWKWKVDALNYMGNNYEEAFRPYIMQACENENEKIRDMALTVAAELSL